MYHSPHLHQHLHHLRLCLPRLSLPEPPDIPQRRLRPLNAKLVFQRDGQTMQGPNRLAMSGDVGVQLAGALESGVKEDFAEAIDLRAQHA